MLCGIRSLAGAESVCMVLRAFDLTPSFYQSQVGTDNVMEFEKKKLSVKRMLAGMKWARDRERRAAEGGAVGEDEDGIGTEQDDVRVRHDGS
eukprot:3934550-Rhodomonas_salina.1